MVSVGLIKCILGEKGQGFLEIFSSICMSWMNQIFSGGSGFGWKRAIGEFSFKCSKSTVSTSG